MLYVFSLRTALGVRKMGEKKTTFLPFLSSRADDQPRRPPPSRSLLRIGSLLFHVASCKAKVWRPSCFEVSSFLRGCVSVFLHCVFAGDRLLSEYPVFLVGRSSPVSAACSIITRGLLDSHLPIKRRDKDRRHQKEAKRTTQGDTKSTERGQNGDKEREKRAALIEKPS